MERKEVESCAVRGVWALEDVLLEGLWENLTKKFENYFGGKMIRALHWVVGPVRPDLVRARWTNEPRVNGTHWQLARDGSLDPGFTCALTRVKLTAWSQELRPRSGEDGSRPSYITGAIAGYRKMSIHTCNGEGNPPFLPKAAYIQTGAQGHVTPFPPPKQPPTNTLQLAKSRPNPQALTRMHADIWSPIYRYL